MRVKQDAFDDSDISYTYYDSQEKILKNMEEKEFNYKLLENKISFLEKLGEQHDTFTKLAVEKAESSLTKQLEQLGFSVQGLAKRFEENIISVTDRNNENAKTMNDKIDTLGIHLSKDIAQSRITLDDKRDAALKNLDDKIAANLKVEIERFRTVDTNMNILISSNADTSNRLINDLNKRMENTVSKDEFKILSSKIDTLQKLVYIGIGGLLVLEFLSKYVFK